MVSSGLATVDHVGPGSGARIGAGCNAALRVQLVAVFVSKQSTKGQSGRRVGRE